MTIDTQSKLNGSDKEMSDHNNQSSSNGVSEQDLLQGQASFMLNNPAPLFKLDQAGIIIQVNPAAITTVGNDPTGESFFSIVNQMDSKFMERLESSNTITIETTIHDRCFLFCLKKDELTDSTYAYGNDITEQKQFEYALEESREQLRVMTEAARDAIVMINDQGKTTFWNASAERIFGYSRAEVIGKDLHKFILPENLKSAHAEGWRKFQKSGTGAAISTSVELKAKRKDGLLIPVELSLSAIQVGDKWHALGLVRDTSDRIVREENHARTVAQYMAMIDAGPAMMFLKDIDHNFIIANRAYCEFVSKPLEELVGRTAVGVLENHEANIQHELEQTAMDENSIMVRQEDRLNFAGEADQWFSTTVVPVHDQQGFVSGVVGMIQDITELHHSREKLVQADKMAAIGTLAAGVAHEINNPVGFISSNLNTMSKYIKKIEKITLGTAALDPEDSESLKEMLDDFGDAIDESLEGAGRVKKIVADMKSFSRVDKSQKEFFNINEGLETTLNIVWNELKYNCTVDKQYGDVPDLYCMPNQLNQVFMNLLINAGHAMTEESGRITITTKFENENLVVIIEDTGKGIPRENLKRIFEPFFTTKDVGQGTGLGLSMAYDIIKKHGGRLEVTSEFGVGSIFTITLPAEGLERA